MYREAQRHVSGLARTARGPSMSAGAGKVEVQGVAAIAAEKALVLRFLQGRNPDWVGRTFFARFDEEAVWLDELKPAVGASRFFDEDEYRRRWPKVAARPCWPNFAQGRIPGTFLCARSHSWAPSPCALGPPAEESEQPDARRPGHRRFPGFRRKRSSTFAAFLARGQGLYTRRSACASPNRAATKQTLTRLGEP